MNRKTLASAVLIPLSFTLGAAATASGQQAAVDFRQSAMNLYKWYLGPMGGMVKGKIPFDLMAFQKNAKGLATVASLDLLAGFPKGSAEDTEAKNAIWERWSDFEKKYSALQQQSEKLASVAAGGDQAAIKAQFGETAKTCKGCHDDFREKK